VTAPIAVVVCTRDRPQTLRRTLDSLAGQDGCPDFEVLVVDQSRDDGTERELARRRRADPRFRHLRPGRPGLSHAYNAATAATGAALLAFTDDDCVADPGWLRAVRAGLAGHPQAGLLYGQVLIPPELCSAENVAGITPGLPIPERRLLDRRHGFRVTGMGANFAARRELLEALGGFDEVLGGGGPLESAQDFDLAYRTFRARWSILLEPEAIVYHYGFRSHREWPATVRSYGIGVGGFYAKHLRAGDVRAASLLLQQAAAQAGRGLVHSLRRNRNGLEWTFLAGVARGMGRSLHFPLDRGRRLYRLPGGGV
jgi:GT2 family glycosyltransferase